MSKRSHHRNNSINVNELAEALTQRGWQPPMPPSNMMPGHPMSNNTNMNNSLSALGNLIGAVNGGNMPQMPGMMPPMQGNHAMMNQQKTSPHPTEQDLLRSLFQQTIRTLRNE